MTIAFNLNTGGNFFNMEQEVEFIQYQTATHIGRVREMGENATTK